jgi:hypothetical protein
MIDLRTLKRRDGTPFPLYMNEPLCEFFRETVQDQQEELESDWEDYNREIFHVTAPNSKFGAGTDGGFGAEVLIPLSYLDSTGSGFSSEALTAIVQEALDRVHAATNKYWNEAYPDKQVTAETVYDFLMSEDQSTEEWYELEQQLMKDECVIIRMGLFYYGPESTSPWQKPGIHEAYGFVVAEFDGHFLPNKTLHLGEFTMPFDPAHEPSLRRIREALDNLRKTYV